jgi:hypothetical protein
MTRQLKKVAVGISDIEFHMPQRVFPAIAGDRLYEPLPAYEIVEFGVGRKYPLGHKSPQGDLRQCKEKPGRSFSCFAMIR